MTLGPHFNERVFRWTDNHMFDTERKMSDWESLYTVEGEDDIDALGWIAENIHLRSPNIVVFPPTSSLKNSDPIPLISVKRNTRAPHRLHISTSNVIGVARYVGSGGKPTVRVEVGSRFDNSDRQMFLMYLFSTVLEGAFISDGGITADSIWDVLLVLLFGLYLQRAIRKGIYREYTTLQFHDSSFRGTVDTINYFKYSIPFTGKLSFNSRELTVDNPILNMVRQALEKIENGPMSRIWRGIFGHDANVIEATRKLRDATRGFQKHRLYHRDKASLRPIRHTYYGEYEELRRVSLLFLNGEGRGLYGESIQSIHGIVCDVSWLWECFVLKKLLLGLEDLSFAHSSYQLHRGIHYFEQYKGLMYPDFLDVEQRIVLDAKYKPKWSGQYVPEDLHQMFSYLLLTGAQHGGVIYPVDAPARMDTKTVATPYRARGDHPRFHRLPLFIPQGVASYSEFETLIEANVRNWRTDLVQVLQGAR